MKKLMLIAAVALLSSCGSSDTSRDTKLDAFRHGGVVQSTEGDESRLLCGNKTCIMTIVWVNKEIVFSSYIPVTADSAAIKHQLDSANAIYKNIKRL